MGAHISRAEIEDGVATDAASATIVANVRIIFIFKKRFLVDINIVIL